MKNKQELVKLTVKEAKRCGIRVSEDYVSLDVLLAFVNIVYLTGAVDALQDERKAK